MKKIFRFAIVLALAGTALLTGCTKDYGTEIADLTKQVNELTSKFDKIQAAFDNGAVLQDVKATSDGVAVIVNKNGTTTTYNITNGKDGKDGLDGKNGTNGTNGTNGSNGKDGKDGKDGSVVTIGADGYWYIDGVKTEYKAAGEKGEKGDPGDPGKPGDPGAPGKDGISWEIKEVNGVLSFVSNEDPATVKPVFADGKTPVTAVWDKDASTLTLFNVDGAENGTVTFSTKATLASIVTIPQFYYGGIEALYYHYLGGQYVTVAGTATGTDYEDAGNYSVKAKNTSTPALAGRNPDLYSLGAEETAEYHINPQAYKFEEQVSQWGFNCIDRDYVEVRAGEAGWSAEFKGITRKNTNIGAVKFTIKNADKLNPSTATQKVVSVLSLYGVDKTNDNKIVTSDYAAVVATPEALKHLAFTKNYQAKDCAGTPVITGKKMLFESAGEAAENPASVEVKYNGGPFALDFVGVHVEGDTKISTLAEIQAKYPELDLKYELIDYTVGSNVTSENAFGIIEKDTKVFDPAYAKTNAAGTGWDVVKINKDNAGEGISAVGRRPIVLATLVDKSGKILLAGYFKIKISETALPPYDPTVNGFNIKTFGEPLGYACEVLANETKWYDMSYQVLEQGLGITFNEFRKNYTWEADKTYVLDEGKTGTALSDYKLTTATPAAKYNRGKIVYVKDTATTGDADITGVNDIFQLSVDKTQAENIGVGKSQTLYAHFTNTKGDHVFIGLTFTIGDKPAVSFIKKNPVYWFNDCDVAADAKTDLGLATVRNNVRVPLHWKPGDASNSRPVTEFDKDIDDDWLENTVKIVKAGTTTAVTGATYTYRFSANNKDITVNGKKWAKVDDGTLNWDGTQAITLTPDGIITFACNDKTKKLINWGTNPQEKVENPELAEHLLYCNVDIVATVPAAAGTVATDCELLVETIHVRFLRPVYLKFNPEENHLVDGEATGSRVPFGTLFSARDWQNYPIFTFNKTTKAYTKGYYPAGSDAATCEVDWYDYYGFQKLIVDLDTVETDQRNPGSGAFESLKVVNKAAIVGLIDPANPTNPITSGKKEIDITNLDALSGWQFWYANNMGYALDFNLKVKVTLTYSWGEFDTDVVIPVWGTKHNYQN